MDRSIFLILMGWVLLGTAVYLGPQIWFYAHSSPDPCAGLSRELSDASAEPARVTVALQTFVIPLENTTIPRIQNPNGQPSVTPFQRCKYVNAASKQGYVKAGFHLPGARKFFSASVREAQYYDGDHSFIELTIYPLSLEKNSDRRNTPINEVERLSRGRYIEKNGEKFLAFGENTFSRADLYYETDSEDKFYIECPMDLPGKICDGGVVNKSLNLYANIQFVAFEEKLDPVFFISKVGNELRSWSVGAAH
ncbi:hypothetical protein [Rhizobium sp. C4]|uniref:hypothetical protein n=1 Tax=Rhizobium sp. C4 TaxID=1349800 RepID=UPI001E5CF4DD|nr:hypothetical protein [Rhizobium sp. C4]MCD2174076.1 hypothetical protein [Rhizobium sp. C4]